MFLFLQNFIKFSSSCASVCSIAIVYIVMDTGEIYIFLDFFFLIMWSPIYYTYIFWYFILNKLYMFIPGNVFVYYYSKKSNERFKFYLDTNESYGG